MRGVRAAAAGGLVVAATLGACLPAGVAAGSSAPGYSATLAPVAVSPAALSPAAVAPGRTVRCTTKVAAGPRLARVRTALVAAHGYPFGLATARRGHWAFVTRVTSSIGIFTTRSFVPEFIRSVRLPAADGAIGDTLTRDGRYLLAATNNGLVVISVARAERGGRHAALGTLSVPRGEGGIEVAVSRDGRYAFVSLEDSFELAVFDLHRALTRGFGPADLVGTIPTGAAPVGLAVSPSGRYLYSTSELTRHGHTSQGTLSVISVRRAEQHPARSVISTVYAGCGTVRVVTSRSGSVVWVTARESDALLAFSAARLRRHPRHSRLADVRVGEAPVGLALVDGGRRIVVADSNRFGQPGARASLGVVSVAAALHHRRALLGYLRAGQFPRQMALEPGGRTLLVGNFMSQQLEAVDVAELP